MNRRIRNRTYGGVGGRRGQPRLLPDEFIVRGKCIGFVRATALHGSGAGKPPLHIAEISNSLVRLPDLEIARKSPCMIVFLQEDVWWRGRRTETVTPPDLGGSMPHSGSLAIPCNGFRAASLDLGCGGRGRPRTSGNTLKARNTATPAPRSIHVETNRDPRP